MNERGPENHEQKFEKVPSVEEVFSALRELAPDRFTEIRRREDERGLYLLEVTAPGKSENETIEFGYMRKGRHPEGEITATEIHVTYYVDSEPISGTDAAKYINGEWKITI